MSDNVKKKLTLEGLTFVSLAGELDEATAPALRQALTPIPEATQPDVVVDLRQVEFLDYATVALFLATRSDLSGAACRANRQALPGAYSTGHRLRRRTHPPLARPF